MSAQEELTFEPQSFNPISAFAPRLFLIVTESEKDEVGNDADEGSNAEYLSPGVDVVSSAYHATDEVRRKEPAQVARPVSDAVQCSSILGREEDVIHLSSCRVSSGKCSKTDEHPQNQSSIASRPSDAK